MSTYKPHELSFDEQMLAGVMPAFLTRVPWQNKLAEKIFQETGDAKMKDWPFTIRGWNKGIIDKMFTLSKKSLLSGASMDIYIKANAGVSLETARSFIKNLSEFIGKDVTEGIASELDVLLSKAVVAASDALEGLGQGVKEAPGVVKSLPLVLIILAVGVGGYLVFAGKKGTKLTPF